MPSTNTKEIEFDVYTINERKIDKIYSDTASMTHTGNRWIYLYQNSDNKEYLLQYSPIIFNGIGTYQYEIFSFDQIGEIIKLRSTKIDFDLNHADNYQKAENDALEKISQLNREYSKYLTGSIPLIEIGSEYMSNENSKDYNDIINKNDLKDEATTN